MTIVELSGGKSVDAEHIKKVSLWFNPTRLQIDLDDENKQPIGVYGDAAAKDADRLEQVRDKNKLGFLVFRASKDPTKR